MDPTLASLLEAVLLDPSGITRWQVAADWLEEQGDGRCAALRSYAPATVCYFTPLAAGQTHAVEHAVETAGCGHAWLPRVRRLWRLRAVPLSDAPAEFEAWRIGGDLPVFAATIHPSSSTDVPMDALHLESGLEFRLAGGDRLALSGQVALDDGLGWWFSVLLECPTAAARRFLDEAGLTP